MQMKYYPKEVYYETRNGAIYIILNYGDSKVEHVIAPQGVQRTGIKSHRDCQACGCGGNNKGVSWCPECELWLCTECWGHSVAEICKSCACDESVDYVKQVNKVFSIACDSPDYVTPPES